MSTAVDSSPRIQSSRFSGSGLFCGSIFESPGLVDRRDDDDSEINAPAEELSNGCGSLTTSSSSSIGRNSDVSGRSSDGEEDSCENEAESKYKEPLEMMESLEEVLPMRRGISKFYNGKSKSFTSLVESSSTSSVKEIAKSENAYTRKRRNLLVFNHVWDKNRNIPMRSNHCGISKRPISSSRSSIALAFAMRSPESNSSCSEDSNSRSPPARPPLHPRTRASHNNLASATSLVSSHCSTWRSYSLADLRKCGYVAATNTSFPENSDEMN